MPDLRQGPSSYWEARSRPHFRCVEQRGFQEKILDRQLDRWFQGSQKSSGSETETQEPSEKEKEKHLGNKYVIQEAHKGRGRSSKMRIQKGSRKIRSK